MHIRRSLAHFFSIFFFFWRSLSDQSGENKKQLNYFQFQLKVQYKRLSVDWCAYELHTPFSAILKWWAQMYACSSHTRLCTVSISQSIGGAISLAFWCSKSEKKKHNGKCIFLFTSTWKSKVESSPNENRNFSSCLFRREKKNRNETNERKLSHFKQSISHQRSDIVMSLNPFIIAM